jgi:hypothetical protein
VSPQHAEAAATLGPPRRSACQPKGGQQPEPFRPATGAYRGSVEAARSRECRRCAYCASRYHFAEDWRPEALTGIKFPEKSIWPHLLQWPRPGAPCVGCHSSRPPPHRLSRTSTSLPHTTVVRQHANFVSAYRARAGSRGNTSLRFSQRMRRRSRSRARSRFLNRGGSVKLLAIKIIPPIACLNNQASLHRLRVTSERALRMTAITGRAPTPTIGGSKWLRLSTVYNRKP